VQDFGCGIPSDKLDSLFINFGTLAEHQKNNPSGRGLGLSICKSIVEKMGGNVSVESVVGEGTKFNLTFKTVSHLSNSKQQEES
jgi:signal transduction histidine kinase